MTCVAAVSTADLVVMGGDCAGSNGHTVQEYADSKVFAVELKPQGTRLLLGYTTSFRMGQVIQHSMDWPRFDASDEAWPWLVKCVVPVMRRLLSDHGWLEKKSEREVAGKMLIGLGSELFTMDSDFHVFPHKEHGFAAIGSGEEVALGSLHTSQALGAKDPQARVHAALSAASDMTPFVRDPFTILKTVDAP